MLSRFLCETAVHLQDPRYETSAQDFQQIGDAWQDVAEWCKSTSETANPASLLAECVDPLQAIAIQEEKAWTKLHQLTTE